jgi:hypothetical protein
MRTPKIDTPADVTQCLTPQQERAVGLLLGGATVTAVAAGVGVSRETVHRWLRRDWPFVAAMNQGRRELHEAASARLAGVCGRAVENLARAVEEGDLKASLFVLKGFAVPIGQTYPLAHANDEPGHWRRTLNWPNWKPRALPSSDASWQVPEPASRRAVGPSDARCVTGVS